jgi:hypothetical protein
MILQGVDVLDKLSQVYIVDERKTSEGDDLLDADHQK